MPNRENKAFRAGNTWIHVGKLGNIVSSTKMFLNRETFFLTEKQVLFLQLNASATMFTSQLTMQVKSKPVLYMYEVFMTLFLKYLISSYSLSFSCRMYFCVCFAICLKNTVISTITQTESYIQPPVCLVELSIKDWSREWTCILSANQNAYSKVGCEEITLN